MDADGRRLWPGSRQAFRPSSPVYLDKALAGQGHDAGRHAGGRLTDGAGRGGQDRAGGSLLTSASAGVVFADVLRSSRRAPLDRAVRMSAASSRSG